VLSLSSSFGGWGRSYDSATLAANAANEVSLDIRKSDIIGPLIDRGCRQCYVVGTVVIGAIHDELAVSGGSHFTEGDFPRAVHPTSHLIRLVYGRSDSERQTLRGTPEGFGRHRHIFD
jgi:hypothetical protein